MVNGSTRRRETTLRQLAGGAALCAGLLGCNAPAPPSPTGGTEQPPSACGRGLVVVGSDYQSTNVSLVGLDGEVLSSSFLSSATTSATLTAPLSGDVAVPTMPAEGREIVLLDRYPAAVLSWVAVADGGVRAQLDVATGFAANPQDYAPVADGKAYVSRYETNPTPGSEPFDGGSDLLVVDSDAAAVSGRIDLRAALQPGEEAYAPHPNRIVQAGRFAFVLLAAYSSSYVESAPSRIATIDTGSDRIVDVTLLDGLHGCAGLMAKPDGAALAVTCSGQFGGSATPSPDASAVVLFALEQPASPDDHPTLIERARRSAAALTGAPLGFTVDFTPSGHLLLTAMGQFGTGGSPDVVDRLIEVEPTTGEYRVIHTTDSLPFELGEVRCTLPCDGCYAADAEAGHLLRLAVGADGWLTVAEAIAVDTAIGLPPRGLGRF